MLSGGFTQEAEAYNRDALNTTKNIFSSKGMGHVRKTINKTQARIDEIFSFHYLEREMWSSR